MPQTLSQRTRLLRLFDVRYLGPRTTVYVLAINLVLLVLAIAIIRYSLTELVAIQDHELLERRVSYVVSKLQDADTDDMVRDIVNQQRVPASLHKRVYTLVYDARGNLFAASASAQAWDWVLPDSLPIPKGVPSGETVRLLYSNTGRIFAYQMATVHHGPFSWTVVIAADHDVEQALTNRLAKLIPATIIMLIVISLLLSWVIIRSTITPLRQLTEHVSSVHSVAKDPNLIPPSMYPIDFQGLVHHYNNMMKRLHGSYTRVASFTSDIAHELRTPLHNLMGEIDVALTKPRDAADYEQLLISNREEVERLNSIVKSLLMLSQTNEIDAAQLESLSLSAELHKLYDYFALVADDARISLLIEAGPDCYIKAHRTLFQQAIGNLLTNAIKFNNPGGTVTIQFSRQGEFGCVKIIDDGPGIPEDELLSIFNRFYKIDQSRSSRAGGTGLGLAIVKNIVERHRGTVRVTSGTGKGACFIVNWPLAGP